jgi:hypothetical protein
MLKHTIKNPKKPGIYLNFKLKKQTHPWDMIGEIEKAKHLEQTAKTHEVSMKHFGKNLLSFKEEPANQLTKILVTPQEMCPKQNVESDEQLLDEFGGPDEGFFLCPFCTCWFNHKKDLNFHLKNWCDREQVNI